MAQAQPRVTLGHGPTQVSFAFEDLCRHTIVFGSSGSGKTTRAFNPLLKEMLGSLKSGGLIICAKGEAVDEAVEIARLAGRQVIIVQPGSERGIDLLSGNPDLDSMYFRDTYGKVEGEAKQWVEAAVARMKNALRMLAGAGDQYYTFGHLTSYCFDDDFQARARILAMDRMRNMGEERAEERWTIQEAIDYEEQRWNKYTPEVRRLVQFAISQLLEPLRDYRIQKTFAGNKNTLIPIESVFEGQIIILHVPRSRYQRAANAVYTMAKRRFFTAVENRRSNKALNQTRPVIFGVDEYQLCISESDVDSLGVIRSAGCMVLATTQGVASLYTALPRDVVDAALQNFTQKLFFKTDDHETLATLIRATQHTKSGFKTEELFAMNRNQGVAHLTVGDQSVDGVMDLEPLFVSTNHIGGGAAAGAAPAAAAPQPQPMRVAMPQPDYGSFVAAAS
jgi:type IV secretory pathway TraG/TraD family ATPase VirD4